MVERTIMGWTRLFYRLCLAFLLTLLAGAVAANTCSRPDLRTDVRPGDPSKPTEVTVSMGIVDFMGVDDVGQQLDLDVFISYAWQDPRLLGLSGCRLPVTSVWLPKVRLLNSSNLRVTFSNARDEVAIGADGLVTHVQRYTGLISSYHNLRKFPFDSHTFKVDIVAVQDESNQVRFVPDTENTWIADRLNIEGWKVTQIGLHVSDHFLRNANLETSRLTLSISAEREPDFYLYRLLLLLTFVVGMSWVIFWVPPSRFEFQIGIGATSMLTAIAFNLAISGRLPPVGYLTTLDKLVIWAILLIFLSIIEALVAGRMVLAGNEHRALRLDRISRVLFPAALFMGWYYMIVF